MTTFGRRVIGAARLDSRIYEEVEHDSGATGQAALVVVLSSLAAGIGLGGPADGRSPGLLAATLGALIGWAAWAALTYFIGTRLLPQAGTRADLGQLLRTIGFAASPGLLRVFGAIPGLTVAIFVAVSVWMLVAMIIAVRQALDFSSTGRAVAVCVAGWVLSLIVAAVVGLVFGPSVY
jgi:hypothetical protein